MKAALSLLHINVYNFTRVPGNYYEKLTIIKIKKNVRIVQDYYYIFLIHKFVGIRRNV